MVHMVSNRHVQVCKMQRHSFDETCLRLQVCKMQRHIEGTGSALKINC